MKFVTALADAKNFKTSTLLFFSKCCGDSKGFVVPRISEFFKVVLQSVYCLGFNSADNCKVNPIRAWSFSKLQTSSKIMS